MASELKTSLSRRRFLKSSLITGATWLTGVERKRGFGILSTQGDHPFGMGKLLGMVEFIRERSVAMETASGTGLDGRLLTDLSALTPERVITPTERFYIRTRASTLLDDQKMWRIRMGGLVNRPLDLTSRDLERMAKALGAHLMECSGNSRSAHFGMLSVANWEGVPVADVLKFVRRESKSASVMISGFDTYSEPSTTSVPGASWIFSFEELTSSKAFLATGMNGAPLTKDHGAPVRLVVPGWYGCTCIKWINEISWVDENAGATTQMQEFASRTMQVGAPKLARDYRPASIDQAAMPIRVEKWFVNNEVKYRVVGILWGGSRPVKALEIRFNPEEDYVRVLDLKHTANDPWSPWTYLWTPKTTGIHTIHLRVRDPVVPARRLDWGFYDRSVEITEI